MIKEDFLKVNLYLEDLIDLSNKKDPDINELSSHYSSIKSMMRDSIKNKIK